MAPKPQPKQKSSFISILAACTAMAAVALIALPTGYDYFKSKNPSRGRVELNLSPVACKDTLHAEQESLEPCVVTTHYAFDPVSKELILFLQSDDVRIPNWETTVATINGKKPSRSLVSMVAN